MKNDEKELTREREVIRKGGMQGERDKRVRGNAGKEKGEE